MYQSYVDYDPGLWLKSCQATTHLETSINNKCSQQLNYNLYPCFLILEVDAKGFLSSILLLSAYIINSSTYDKKSQIIEKSIVASLLTYTCYMYICIIVQVLLEALWPREVQKVCHVFWELHPPFKGAICTGRLNKFKTLWHSFVYRTPSIDRTTYLSHRS